MHDKLNILFNPSNCPEEDQLRSYYKGQLPKKEIRTIEEHLLDCEMCSDYLEGLSLLSNTNELDKEASVIISKVNATNSKKNRIWFYATAASVFLGISLFSIIWFLPSNTNYVADKLEVLSTKNDKHNPFNDSTLFVNNQNEIGINNKSQSDGEIINTKTTINQLSPVQPEAVNEITQSNYNIPVIPADIKKESEQQIIEDKEDIAAVSSYIQEKPKITDTENNKNIAGGVSQDIGLIKDATGKAEKPEKKSNRFESKNKSGYTVSNEVVLDEKASAIISKSDVPGKEVDDYSEDGESNIDLDKSHVFINQQMGDSAIVYALRATDSCNLCKWTAMFVLSKAYFTAGQTEKAIATLKEIKTKAPDKYAKEAKTELEKLGY